SPPRPADRPHRRDTSSLSPDGTIPPHRMAGLPPESPPPALARPASPARTTAHSPGQTPDRRTAKKRTPFPSAPAAAPFPRNWPPRNTAATNLQTAENRPSNHITRRSASPSHTIPHSSFPHTPPRSNRPPASRPPALRRTASAETPSKVADR